MRLLVLLGVLAMGSVFGLDRIEREAIYPFDPTRATPPRGMVEKWLKVPGAELIVWVAQPAQGKPVILYFHGNAGNLATRTPRFRQFMLRGYGVVAPAYRGSSGSTGKPIEAKLAADAQAVYGAIRGWVGKAPAVVYGESLGTGVALRLAAELSEPPSKMVLEAPYTSLPDVVRGLYPQLERLIPKMKNIWDSLGYVQEVDLPILVVHGARDDLIPVQMGEAIHAAAGNSDKQLIKLPNAGHTDIWQHLRLRDLWQFIER